MNQAGPALKEMLGDQVYFPENEIETFYEELIKETSQLIEPHRLARTRILRAMQRTTMSALLPFTGRYRRAMKQSRELTKTAQRIGELEAQKDEGTLELSGVDPVYMYGELIGVPREEIQRKIRDRNIAGIVEQVSVALYRMPNLIPAEIYGNDLPFSQTLRYNVINRVFGDGMQGAELIRRFPTSEAYVGYFVNRAYKLYKKEAKRIEKAKARSDKRRSGVERRYASYQSFELTKEEFRQLFVGGCSKPLLGLYEMVHAQ